MTTSQTHLDRLLDAALEHAAFDGWTEDAMLAALDDSGLADELCLQAAPKGAPGKQAEFRDRLIQAARNSGAHLRGYHLMAPKGALDVIAYWSARLDQHMLDTLSAADLKSMKIRERVTLAVQSRLEAIGQDDEAARRARARLMLHDAGTLGAELIWATSDKIWRALNDPSTDFNWYSKRAILSAVYTSSLSAWLNDETPDKAKAKAFLDRRIQNVMEFEKAKASWRKLTQDLPDPAEVLARFRYPRRRA